MEHIRTILESGSYRNAIPTPTSYDDPQPMTAAERINVGDMAHTFAALRPATGIEVCLKTAQEMAEGTSPTPWAFCYGGVGNGKTHLLEATVIRLNERGLFTRYYTWAQAVGNLRRFLRNTDKMTPPYDVILERWSHSPRLVIDDLGMGTTDTDWELAQLESILTERYRLKLWTMLATNQDIKTLPPRIVSRLLDAEVCTSCLNRAPDFRKGKKRK